MTSKTSTWYQENKVAQAIPEKDILWIVHIDGRISKKHIDKDSPFATEYPISQRPKLTALPIKKENESLRSYYQRLTMAEESRYFKILRWEKEQTRKLQKIKAAYRKQQFRQAVKTLLQKIFDSSKQR